MDLFSPNASKLSFAVVVVVVGPFCSGVTTGNRDLCSRLDLPIDLSGFGWNHLGDKLGRS